MKELVTWHTFPKNWVHILWLIVGVRREKRKCSHPKFPCGRCSGGGCRDDVASLYSNLKPASYSFCYLVFISWFASLMILLVVSILQCTYIINAIMWSCISIVHYDILMKLFPLLFHFVLTSYSSLSLGREICWLPFQIWTPVIQAVVLDGWVSYQIISPTS